MDRENFDAIITRYLEKFDYTNGEKPEEYFKWSAIARFQKNWNLESDDLYDCPIRELTVRRRSWLKHTCADIRHVYLVRGQL